MVFGCLSPSLPPVGTLPDLAVFKERLTVLMVGGMRNNGDAGVSLHRAAKPLVHCSRVEQHVQELQGVRNGCCYLLGRQQQHGSDVLSSCRCHCTRGGG